jgi:hypothetical protein
LSAVFFKWLICVSDNVRRTSGKALVPCGKANIGGEFNWKANLTYGLQIRQPEGDRGLWIADC